jgi:L-threonylcarbamoyladenylate synthase
MASLWRIKEAAASIEAGDVIACPAEAVWGLSCDPWNLSAVAFLCEMKQRELSKGVIVASGDAVHFGPLLDALDDDERRCVLSSWPGPVTWLVPNRGYFPSWVTGESNEVAIRVTSAPALSNLCRELGGPVVTTSANWAGAQPAKHLFQVRRYFGSEIAVVPGDVDLAGKPSTIKRIKTGEVLR